ncbi:Abi-alpha family protein [Rhizobium leguminosarum]|uniref:Abi-alpha family protein n=1 Tax=Rhizobium leguminosarum TaxID=384 RepID=UPI003F96277E
MNIDNVSIEIDAKATNKLIDLVSDVFSPATEALVALSQVVRLARLELVAKIMRRTKQIAQENGTELVLPPLKFLVPFYEKASIQDEGSKALSEMWSRLLAMAGSNYDERMVKFTSLLSELSAQQAKILDEVATNFGRSIDDRGFELVRQDFVKHDIRKAIRLLHATNHDKAFKELLRVLQRPGVSIARIEFDIEDTNDEHYVWSRDTTYSDDRRLDFEILVSMGLLLHISTGFIDQDDDGTAVALECYALTELGYAFWSACTTAV